ncbi:MAG: histidinol phosphate phosphatase [Ruminococcaceae bacterium]|nr:histidinol phosphate phosphatase [Oscillospiraceae bacterium]
MQDLHIHIERGPYEKQWIDRFVEQAVKMSIDEINLLEHTIRIKEFHPAFKEAREYSLYQRRWFDGKQKQAHTLDEYKRLIDSIRASDYPIKINFGLEVCWFEQHEEFLRSLLADNYFDYVLGSVHWIDNWTFNQRKYQWLGKDVNHIYKRYYEMSNSLVSSGIFDIIAHPDLVRCHSLYPDFDLADTYKELCRNAVKNNVMIEMNTSKGAGINPQFLQIAKAEGVKFSLGSDAHRPEDVGRGIKEVYNIVNS